MITKMNMTIANVYLVQSQKTVLVDTSAPNSAEKILKAIGKQGIAPQDISLILLTHAHSDHAGSAGALRELTGAPVAVHQGDAAMLKRGTNGDFVSLGREAAISRPFVDRPFPGIEADILLTGESDLTEFGLEAELIHTPGHSEGSISLIFPDKQAIIGDILRGGIMGGTFLSGKPNYPYFLPDLANKTTIHESVRKVLASGAQTFYVGHGGPLKNQDIVTWLNKETKKIAELPVASQQI